MGFVNEFQFFLAVAFFSGIFTDVGGPAYEAVFMDILPEEKRASGFGIRRVAFNLAVVIGPVIGGFVAARSYLALFIIDAVISAIVALLVFLLIPETKPQAQPGEKQESTTESFAGYLKVLRDGRFIAFTLVSLLTWLVYMNMNTTLGVYLRDEHGIPASGYGTIISINAAMVVLMQFPITRRAEKQPPMLMMALGAFFIAAGLALYGFVGTYAWFAVAIAILTIGEMITIPISNAVVANFAPQEMRGRYNFIYGLSWGISFGIGPYLAGRIMDNYDPNLLWYACGIVGLLSVAGIPDPEPDDSGQAGHFVSGIKLFLLHCVFTFSEQDHAIETVRNAWLVLNDLTGTVCHHVTEASIDVRSQQRAEQVDELTRQGDVLPLRKKFVEDHSSTSRLERLRRSLQTGLPIRDDGQDQVEDDRIKGSRLDQQNLSVALDQFYARRALLQFETSLGKHFPAEVNPGHFHAPGQQRQICTGADPNDQDPLTPLQVQKLNSLLSPKQEKPVERFIIDGRPQAVNDPVPAVGHFHGRLPAFPKWLSERLLRSLIKV